MAKPRNFCSKGLTEYEHSKQRATILGGETMERFVICGSLGPGRKVSYDEFLRMAVQSGMKVITLLDRKKQKVDDMESGAQM